MEIILFWVVAGGVTTVIGLRKGQNDLPSMLYYFFAWPLALTQALWQSRGADSLEPPEPRAELAPQPPAVPAPETPALLTDASDDPAADQAIRFTLDLPSAKDGQPPSQDQLDQLAGRGLALEGGGLTFDQAAFLIAALTYVETLFAQQTGEAKAPLPLMIETVNGILADTKLATYIRRWNAGRKANPAADPSVVRLAENWQLKAILAAMVSAAPKVARRLEAEIAKRPAASGPAQFRVALASPPAERPAPGLSPKTVLAQDLKRPLLILYENLEGEVRELKITLLELYEEDGQLVLRGSYGQVHALRNFRVERIVRLTDLESGESPEDPEAYLRTTFAPAEAS